MTRRCSCRRCRCGHLPLAGRLLLHCLLRRWEQRLLRQRVQRAEGCRRGVLALQLVLLVLAGDGHGRAAAGCRCCQGAQAAGGDGGSTRGRADAGAGGGSSGEAHRRHGLQLAK